MEFRAKRKFWKKATLLMWTVRRFWTVIMPTLHVCSLSGKPLHRKKKLVRVAKECLEVGMEAARPFGFVGDIGHAVEKHAKKNGFSVVRDLCGHGVGVEFHEEPDVEHFGKKGTGMLLVPGMVFTIEPMINMGTWEVFIDEEDGWTVVTEDELPSAQWEHTFVMTEQGLEILTY